MPVTTAELPAGASSPGMKDMAARAGGDVEMLYAMSDEEGA